MQPFIPKPGTSVDKLSPARWRAWRLLLVALALLVVFEMGVMLGRWVSPGGWLGPALQPLIVGPPAVPIAAPAETW